MDTEHIRGRLDYLYRFFAVGYLDTSMLSIPHIYMERIGRDKLDVETMAFLAAIYDYQWRVPSIRLRFLELVNVMAEHGIRASELSDPDVAQGVIGEALGRLRTIFHRFDRAGEAVPLPVKTYVEDDHEEYVRRCLEKGESMFIDICLLRSLWRTADRLGISGNEMLRRILPRRDTGPLKRLNLFLRWVVRDEYPDLGLWRSIDKSHLLMPYDMGIARVIGRIFYGYRRGLPVNRRRYMLMSTRLMRRLSPGDPARYDYVLSRPALLGLCHRVFDYSHCQACPFKSICRAGRGHVSQLFYTDLKEPIEKMSLRRAIEIHNTIARTLHEKLLQRKGYLCMSDYAIDHGFRPDLYCRDGKEVIGEVKVNLRARQGPAQMLAYAKTLEEQGRLRNPEGIIAYSNYGVSERIEIEHNVKLIREAAALLGLKRYYDSINIYIVDYRAMEIRYVYTA